MGFGDLLLRLFSPIGHARESCILSRHNSSGFLGRNIDALAQTFRTHAVSRPVGDLLGEVASLFRLVSREQIINMYADCILGAIEEY